MVGNGHRAGHERCSGVGLGVGASSVAEAIVCGTRRLRYDGGTATGRIIIWWHYYRVDDMVACGTAWYAGGGGENVQWVRCWCVVRGVSLVWVRIWIMLRD